MVLANAYENLWYKNWLYVHKNSFAKFTHRVEGVGAGARGGGGVLLRTVAAVVVLLRFMLLSAGDNKPRALLLRALRWLDDTGWGGKLGVGFDEAGMDEKLEDWIEVKLDVGNARCRFLRWPEIYVWLRIITKDNNTEDKQNPGLQ